ncbi:hypothetical protein KAH55_06040 [bacterium]|nr:hypothetical protein [bacterium]
MKFSGDVPIQVIYNQPSYTIETDQVALAVTKIGAHMAPVTFFNNSDKPVMPYHIAPWWKTGIAPDQPNILKILRGDFFCCPFGGNDTPLDGKQFPAHGESPNNPWELTNWKNSAEGALVHLTQKQKHLSGTIDRKLALKTGHNVVYSQSVLSNMDNETDLGHHANLAFPNVPGCGHLAFSKFKFAQVYVHPVENPAEGGYSTLLPGAEIKNLRKVPMITGETTDLTRYPARCGFEDIVIICADPDLDFAWTTVTFPEHGYVWFALKDPKVLASTLLWMSNRGRHYEPWNSRHFNVMGLEEITGYFHEGIAESVAPNSLNERGIPTSLKITPEMPVYINNIQGVAKIPANFDEVSEIKPINAEEIMLISRSGEKVTVPCQLDFIKSGKLGQLV